MLAGLCSSRPRWPQARNFCLRATRKTYFLHKALGLSTPADFMDGSLWAPYDSSKSTAWLVFVFALVFVLNSYVKMFKFTDDTYEFYILLVALNSLLFVDIQGKFCREWTTCPRRKNQLIICNFLAAVNGYFLSGWINANNFSPLKGFAKCWFVTD